jgi:formylglycine-generating enzyme required for sulfatase activity
MKLQFFFFGVLLISGWTARNATAAITMQTVPVGDIGNANDSTGRGEVDYNYSIGKYEVTVGQYAAFLNAVAKTDTYGLYHVNMGFLGDITRTGGSGSFLYTVGANANKPITYVSWFDAARFANWMQNGQPNGPQGIGTTESGSYNLNGATTGVGFTRNSGAVYSIPTDAEWYKAAYYQPADKGGDADNYWLYPTRSNTQPNSRNGSSTDPNSANYYYNDGIANGFNGGYAVNNSTNSPFDGRTVVGAFSLASSYCGTFDQGGNVLEWEDFVSGGGRGILGGDSNELEGAMEAGSWYNVSDPSAEYGNLGFRIVLVPEPTSLSVLVVLMLAGVLRYRTVRSAKSA